MGIKGLWGVLAPHSEKKSLHEIGAQTIAVDLSGWVCDSQNVTDYHVQPKLYLRNLFFRTIYLLLAEIDPIFVLEGDAPELKQNVMAARNAIQFRGAAPRTEEALKKRPDIARNRFKNVLKECESLLKCMGVRCIKGRGEAEATCAELNARGLVDAVVSQDSDCFAYGARIVYRNFSVSSSAGGSALQGSIDYYDAERMFQKNGFGRNKMVALALLCGCDYGVGACGSSINTVVSFLHTVSDNDIIPRLLSWVSDPRKYEELDRWVSVPGRCDRCGHAGRTHAKNGCPTCATHKGCSDNGHKTKVGEVKRELLLRTKAMSCGVPFPEPKVMKEFLNATPEDINTQHLKKPVPNLIQFVKLMVNKLAWSERYCVEKFLPLLTKWHLQDNVPCRTIKPIMIKKKRNPRGVPSYEIVWGDIDGEYEGLIPDDQFEVDEDKSKSWTTIERQDSIRQYYPELVETYEQSIRKPQIEKKRRGRKKQENIDSVKPKRKYTKKSKKHVDADVNLNNSMKNSIFALTKSETSSSKLNVSVKVNKLKRKLKNTSKGKGQKTMHSFILSKRRKSNKKVMKSLQCSFKNMTLDNDEEIDTEFLGIISHGKENLRENNHYLSMLNNKTDDCDICDSDLSDIVDNIVTRAPLTKTAKVDNKLVKLIFHNKHSTPRKGKRKSVLNEVHNHCSTPSDSPIRTSSYKFSEENFNYFSNHKANTSYFFDKLSEDPDAFELSFDYKHKSAVTNLDIDVTIEYSLPDVHL